MRFPEKIHQLKGTHIREFIFGFDDGLVTTLAIAAALTGAGLGNILIIFAGMANMLADGISMALGGYISSKSQFEVYQRQIEKEKDEIKKMPEQEREEIRQIYRKKGFRGKELELIVKRITSNKKLWLDVMMKEELGFTNKFDDPKRIGIFIFLAFVAAGAIPIIPFLFFETYRAFEVAVYLSFFSLFLIGAIKTFYTGRNWLKSGIEMLLIGLAAAGVAFLIGRAIPLV